MLTGNKNQEKIITHVAHLRKMGPGKFWAGFKRTTVNSPIYTKSSLWPWYQLCYFLVILYIFRIFPRHIRQISQHCF
jgi:hypothetical protein